MPIGITRVDGILIYTLVYTHVANNTKINEMCLLYKSVESEINVPRTFYTTSHISGVSFTPIQTNTNTHTHTTPYHTYHTLIYIHISIYTYTHTHIHHN